MKTSIRDLIQPRFPPARLNTRDTRLTTDQTTHNRPMKKWQSSLDKRPKPDDVYQRRLRNDETAMGNARQHNGSRFSPLAEIHDEPEMNWQNNTMRQVDDAKDMDTNHLHDDSTLQTTDNTRLSSKKHATQSSSNNSKVKKHANKTEIHVLSPTLHLNRKDKMLYVPLQFDKYENHALLDTGAIQSDWFNQFVFQ